MKKQTTENQKVMIRKFLKRYGSITMLYACHHMNVHRLSERIRELKKTGLNIKTVIMSNRTAKYVLIK